MNEKDFRTIVCFGNSITQGYGVLPEQSFPAILGNLLHVPVINAGRDGDTIAGALERVEPDVLRHKPSLVTVELGANDFLSGNSEDLAWNNLELIIGKIRESGADVAVISLGVQFWGKDWEKALARIAEARDCGFMTELLEGILDNSLMTLDGIHPNVTGYILIARRVADFLVEIRNRR
jgi:acyl-CoA thioesterase-1